MQRSSSFRRFSNWIRVHVIAQNSLAWLLATCPEASLRDGGKAIELAKQADQLSGGNHPEILDTLAAAYAEAGRYPEAVETARRALSLIATQNNQPVVDALQMRLKLYEANSPYHEKPVADIRLAHLSCQLKRLIRPGWQKQSLPKESRTHGICKYTKTGLFTGKGRIPTKRHTPKGQMDGWGCLRPAGGGGVPGLRPDRAGTNSSITMTMSMSMRIRMSSKA